MTAQNKLFGELRALLAQPPSAASWEALCGLIDRWPYERLHGEAMPYIEEGLSAWPDTLRLAPQRWLVQLADGGSGRPLRLCRAVSMRGDSDELLRALLGWDRLDLLRALTMEFGSDGDGVVKLLANTPALAGLERLALDGCDVGDVGLRALADSPYLTHLTALSLWDGSVAQQRGAEAVRRWVSSTNVAHLRELSLSGWEAPEHELHHEVFTSAQLGALESLDLSHNYLPMSAVQLLADGALPSLRRLTIGGSYIELSAYRFLCDVAALRGVELVGEPSEWHPL